jgi:hypothetical protein
MTDSKKKMQRPITVLGSGKRPNSPANSNVGMAYALIPMVIVLPIMGYFIAKANHVHVEQFAPLLFIVSGLGLAGIFFTAAEAQKVKKRAEREAKRKALEAQKK